MSDPQFHCVVTTIQPPTRAMRGLARELRKLAGRLLVVGDRKGPADYPLAGAELLALPRQLELPLRLPRELPVNHYARKNVGYLVAFSRGAEVIYETDDDNLPPHDWRRREAHCRARKLARPGWCNIYRYFSREIVWPRGLPLDEIARPPVKLRPGAGSSRPLKAVVQQDLVSGSPDVDAIWRLVMDHPLRF